MASEGPNSPSTVVSDSGVSGGSWQNPGNAVSSDNAYATMNGQFAPVSVEDIVKLVIGGSVVGDNKAANTVTTTDTYYSWGGSSDLWGTTPSETDVNGTTFGVVLRYRDPNGWGIYTEYLKATDFGFSIPTGATIDGVFVEAEVSYSGNTVQIDHVRITVHYTEGGGGGGSFSPRRQQRRFFRRRG